MQSDHGDALPEIQLHLQAALFSLKPGPSRLSFRTAGRDLRAVRSCDELQRGGLHQRQTDEAGAGCSLPIVLCSLFLLLSFQRQRFLTRRGLGSRHESGRPQTDDTRRPCKAGRSRRAFTRVVSLKALAQANSRLPNGLYHKCELRERLPGRRIRLCAAPD